MDPPVKSYLDCWNYLYVVCRHLVYKFINISIFSKNGGVVWFSWATKLEYHSMLPYLEIYCLITWCLMIMGPPKRLFHLSNNLNHLTFTWPWRHKTYAVPSQFIMFSFIHTLPMSVSMVSRRPLHRFWWIFRATDQLTRSIDRSCVARA